MMEQENMIEEATKAAQRLEEANKVGEGIVTRLEEVEARRILGGKTEAGQPVKEETEEEKSTAYTRALLKGTGYDDILFPDGENKNGK